MNGGFERPLRQCRLGQGKVGSKARRHPLTGSRLVTMITRISGNNTIRGHLLLAVLASSACAAESTWQGSAHLDALVDHAIRDGTTPGAVLLVGHQGQVVHRKAYGFRSLVPRREPMTADTVFDCASLTKVLATAPALTMLVEKGQVRLNDPVTRFLPEFAAADPPITVRQLLTHFSGLRPNLDLDPPWSGYETGVGKASRETPEDPPGTRFRYSDINYLLLGEIVNQLSGEPLDKFASERIFEPLGMEHTRFRPPEKWQPRIAPTEELEDGTVLRGVVHDPTTRFMGGVAGPAGVFSTADDLSRFARMMLQGGQLDSNRVLSPLSVATMTSSQSPRGHHIQRGLGWDLDSPYSSPRGDLFPIGSYGHTGYTGTSIWIDPSTETYVILLTNRVHPKPNTSVVRLRSLVATLVAASLTDVDLEKIRRANRQEASSQVDRQSRVLTGLDVLVRDGFQPFAGKGVGLITNHTGIDRQGRRNVDLFMTAPGVQLKAIFTPEHGLEGTAESEHVENPRDPATGVPIHSLYQRNRRRPSPEMLQGVDVLVFDIQDVGTRFYTYITTMAYSMEEAARAGIPFYVLDRPNPITGTRVEGPILEDASRSFIGYFAMPVRHGMTVGELALMFNEERKIGAKVDVVRMEGWDRRLWFDQTSLPWVNPSPNLRTLEQAVLYPGVALLEGLSNWSVGRGTATPFQFVGASWIDGSTLAKSLNQRGLAGVRFYPARRTPSSSRFAATPIDGVQISVIDRESLEPTRLGLHIAAELVRLHSGRIELSRAARWIGHTPTLRALARGDGAPAIWALWENEMEGFLPTRSRYLLY